MPKSLTDEIKQTKPFPRPSAEALVSVMRTAAVLEHAVNDLLRPHGLTVTQYNVLRILRGAGDAGLCGRAVGERLISRVPDVPRLLDRMEEQKLITRERDASDRRHVTARISEVGRRLLEEVNPELEAMELSRFGGLGDDVLRALIDGLAEVRAAL